MKYEPDRYKNVGFKPPSSLEPRPEIVNVGELKGLAVETLSLETVKSGAEDLLLDLDSLGYGKLLGKGSIDFPLNVKITEYSSTALEKIETAGGKIIGVE